MMKKAILLDAGGVILDETEYEKVTAKIIINILRNHLSSYSEEQYWKDVTESIMCFSPHTRQYVFWKYCSDNLSIFKDMWKEFKEAWQTAEPALQLMKGIENELNILQNRFSLLLAGQYGSNLIKRLKESDILKLFVNNLSQDDFAITKPDPRYLEQIAVAANFNCNNCIMVGDRIDKDVIPAKQNGMATVFIKSGIYRIQKPRTPDETPDLILENTNGLADRISTIWAQ
jgi:FMN phosphatase YigB (HAD superfamily)